MYRRTLLSASALATLSVLAACAPAAPPAPALPTDRIAEQDAFKQAMAHGTGFSVGPMAARRVAAVFFDPACPHCAHLWQSSQAVKSEARIVWMPVGLLTKASAPQGATILAAADPVQAMNENEASVLLRTGGITVKSDAVEKFGEKVRVNGNLFDRMRPEKSGVPFLVTEVDGKVKMQAGSLPPDQLRFFLGA